MWTSRDAFGQLESHIVQARQAEDALSSTVQSLSEETARLRAERTGLVRELARVRLDVALRDPVANRLAGAERRARDLLASRAEAMKGAVERRLQVAKGIDEARGLRDKAHDALDDAVEALDRHRGEVSAKVRGTPAWIEADAAVAMAVGIAEEADKKADVAEADMAQKRKPYDADPLFS